MPLFDAHVQYDDLKGTAAADRSDGETLDSYLRSAGLIEENELVINTTCYNGQNGYFAASVHVSNAGDIQEALSQNPVQVRVVNLEIDRDRFFSFFKRFEVSISSHNLGGREYVEV